MSNDKKQNIQSCLDAIKYHEDDIRTSLKKIEENLRWIKEEIESDNVISVEVKPSLNEPH